VALEFCLTIPLDVEHGMLLLVGKLMHAGTSQRLDLTLCLIVVSIVTLHMGPLSKVVFAWGVCPLWSTDLFRC
jgi:hypothetical protein